jgi:hypothetical protein
VAGRKRVTRWGGTASRRSAGPFSGAARQEPSAEAHKSNAGQRAGTRGRLGMPGEAGAGGMLELPIVYDRRDVKG